MCRRQRWAYSLLLLPADGLPSLLSLYAACVVVHDQVPEGNLQRLRAFEHQRLGFDDSLRHLDHCVLTPLAMCEKSQWHAHDANPAWRCLLLGTNTGALDDTAPQDSLLFYNKQSLYIFCSCNRW